MENLVAIHKLMKKLMVDCQSITNNKDEEVSNICGYVLKLGPDAYKDKAVYEWSLV